MAIGGLPPSGPANAGAQVTLAQALAGLKHGDTVRARIQAVLADGVRLAIGRAVVDVATTLALRPGTMVTFTVERNANAVTLRPAASATGQPAPRAVAQVPPGATPQPPPGQSLAPQGTAPPGAAARPTPTQSVVQSASGRQQTAPTTAASGVSSPAAQSSRGPATTGGNQPSPAPARPAVAAPPAASGQPGAAVQIATGAAAQPSPPTTSGQPPAPSQPTGVQPSPQAVQAPPSPAPNSAGARVASPPPAQGPASTISSPPAQTVTSSGAARTPATLADPHAPRASAPLAVAQAKTAAAAAQAGPAGLFADLAALIAQPQRATLPPAIEAAARHLFGLRVTPAAVSDPAGLRASVARAGPFLEAALARGQVVTGDQKAALLALRGLLQGFLGDKAAQAMPRAAGTAPPPDRGGMPQAQQPATATLPVSAGAEEIARALLAGSEATLARLRLLQIANLPDSDGAPRADAATDAQPRTLQIELPLARGQETATLAIRIAQEESRRKDHGDERIWRVRFALDLAETGSVEAMVTYIARQVSVTVWAERDETAASLRAGLTELGDALAAAQLEIDEMAVLTGQAPPPDGAAASGRFVDRTG